MEEWMDLDGFEDFYKISNHGRIYSKIKKRLMNPYYDRYRKAVYVNLYDGNGDCSPYAVKYLVAIHFVPNLQGCKRITLIDGNPMNLRADNMYWGEKPETA